MSTEPTPGEESFAGLVAGLRAGVPELAPPPTLLPDLRRRYARRVALRRAGFAAVPVALVVAVGVGAALVPRGPAAVPPQVHPVQNAADVAAQVSRAITGANQDILEESFAMSVTPMGSPVPAGHQGTVKIWVSMKTGQQRSTAYLDGQEIFDSGLSKSGQFTVVDPRHNTYLTFPSPTEHPELPHGTFTGSEIRSAMASGKLAITARDQQVDGQSTIELTGTLVPKDEEGTPSPDAVPQRFWVNSTTYLPVRMATQVHGTWGNDVDYSWLPPTAENEALLTVTVPAGATQRR
jgi:hypothetical protein